MSLAIITGITGQDGSLLAELLLRKGYKVIGLISDRPLDLFRLNYLGITEKIILKKVDLLSVTQAKQLLEEFKPAEFYNLAAISSVGFSFKEPLNTFEFNTKSVHNILEAIREVSPMTRFYQASSSEMFGNAGHHNLPIKESFLFHPVSPYGISKASAHWLTVNYREAYKLQTCCGILFNHESALRPGHFVIKKIINTAIQIKNGKADALQLGNIAIVRDWGYAPLYVDAMWRMMQQDKLDDYLICSGAPISLQKFVQKVFNALDLNADDHLRLDSGLLRSLDLEIIYGDNSKAKQELNWEYNFGPDELIARLIEDENDFIKWSTSHGTTL
jgi:GDPmannose 4,6-dehydratase